MKWDALKKRVASELYTSVMHGALTGEILADLAITGFREKRGRDRGQTIQAYANAVYEQVIAWDIRCVGRLRDLFPNSFPRTLRKGVLCGWQDDTGTWNVT